MKIMPAFLTQFGNFILGEHDSPRYRTPVHGKTNNHEYQGVSTLSHSMQKKKRNRVRMQKESRRRNRN